MGRFYSRNESSSPCSEHVLTEPVGDLTLKGFPKAAVTYNVTGLAEQGTFLDTLQSLQAGKYRKQSLAEFGTDAT